MKKSKQKHRAELPIVDRYGEVLYRAYVDDPNLGLRNAELEGFIAPFAQMQGLDLSGAHLYWASISDADLSFANLVGAELRGASMDRVVCKGTNFRRANLGLDNLNGRTSLKGADLSSALLDDAILTGAVYDDWTKFPAGFNPADHGMVHVDDLLSTDPAKK